MIKLFYWSLGSMLIFNATAEIYSDRYKSSYQSFFSLQENGLFNYQGQDGYMQGLYGIQGQVLTFQDMIGNQYQ